MAKEIIYLTQEGLVKLQAELVDLKDIKRIEIAEKLKEAISFWDLSENSEYEEARNEQAQVEKKIVDLEDHLKRVEIITEDSHSWDSIGMGSDVVIQKVWSKEKESYKIVGTTEADILAELPKISNDSPIGNAMMWKKKWQKVKLKAPAWDLEYQIISVK